ncbi:MAG: polyprenyl synthetase family protein [Ichthyobacteriaceae bacterium]|nr:polyprenyl synthetase family protein [Ichthyobacteriaceae bacterium]
MKLIGELEKIISQYFKDNLIEGSPAELYNPINYILALGGKRARPLMVLMSYNLYSDSVNDVLSLAKAIEVFHNFTLIHDDIMDKAPLRRGSDTVHIKWNENIGILSGDAMLIKAYSLLEDLSPEILKNVFLAFNKTAIEVCEGQQLDMNFETRNDVTIDEYINMITLKTSVLLGASMKVGAIAGGAEQIDSNKLYDFGKYLGLAFQLQDDYLDLYGDTEKFGKRIGGDIVANKKTFLTLKAFQKADNNELVELNNLFASSNLSIFEEENKIEKARTIFNKLGVVDCMKKEIEKYYELSLQSLASVNVAEGKKAEIRKFAESIISREV